MNTAPTATKASTPPDKRAQHTPGPWIENTDETADRLNCIIGLDGQGVCDNVYGEDKDGAAANMRLISAAPELLDNLMKTNLFLVHVVSCLVTTEPAKGLLQGHIELNNAAIAKAEGKA